MTGLPGRARGSARKGRRSGAKTGQNPHGESGEAAVGGSRRFEDLVSEISARFVHLPGQELDTEIEYALQRLVDFLGVSRANLFQHTQHSKDSTLTHSWAAPGRARPAAISEFSPEEIPWTVKKILSGEATWFSKVEDLPKAAWRDKNKIRKDGILSGLAIPLSIGGAIVGALSFDSLEVERTWPQALIQQLRLVGEVFASALKRRDMELALAEQLGFEQLLSEISARFVSLPAPELDGEIERALKRVVEFLGVDRGNLFQPAGSPEENHLTHSWASPGVKRPTHFVTGDVPWISSQVLAGRAVCAGLQDLPEEAQQDRQTLIREGIRSGLAIPLCLGGTVVGALSFDAFRSERAWPDGLVQRLRLLGEVFANALVRAKNELELRKAMDEIGRLRAQLQVDCEYLKEEIRLEKNYGEFVGKSRALKYVLFRVEQIAPTDTTVLILGESGTGKELVARAIHEASPRRSRPLVKVNCAALPANLIESELFGHEKGAFSGAETKRSGRFEVANGTTLFLDEIGELSLEAQAKLLQVLQEGEFERVGSSSTIRVDVRVIAASNRDLERDIEKGRFREDLWYRLNIFPITIPPLRQRKEDIPLLTHWFVRKCCTKYGKSIDQVPATAMKTLEEYDWQGNVRELENVIERAVITTRGNVLQLLDPPRGPQDQRRPGKRKTLEELDRDYITEILEDTKWKIDGPKGAARILNMNPSTLRSRIRKLGIARPSFSR